jgi:hypothetical protein
MAMRRVLVGVALLMTVVMTVALRPRPAVASSDLQYIIPAALGGAVLIVLVIAVIVSEHKQEPEMDLVDRLPPPVESPQRIHWAPKCPPTAGTLPLFCW